MDGGDWTVNFLLRNIATSAMEQAVYFSTGAVTQEKWSHYGLALDKYTHFTSPIRRYADIIVHRSDWPLIGCPGDIQASDWLS